MPDDKVGDAYIDVGARDDTAADIKRIQKNLIRAMTEAGREAGRSAGEQLADGMASGAREAGRRMQRALKPQIKRIEKDLNDLAEDRKVTFQAEADTKAAAAQLQYAQRDRFVNLFVNVNGTAAAAQVSALIKGLSGASMLGSFKDAVLGLGAALPQTILKVGMLGTALAGLVAPALNALSAIGPLATSLGQIGPLILAVPALALAAGAGIGVLVMAFTNLEAGASRSARRFNRWISGVKEGFAEIRDQVQSNFLKGLVKPLEDLTKTLMPQLAAGLTTLATSMGKQWGAVADAIGRAFSNDKLKVFFDQMTAGTDAATPGWAAIWEALANIALIGGQFLPKIGEWVTKIGQQFLNWTQTADIAGLISNAATQFGLLLDVARELGGIIGGIFTAMDTGKSTGLESLAATLGKISDVVNGPGFQAAMGSIFEGAAKGAELLAMGLGPIGDSFERLAPVIGHFLEVLGGAASSVLQQFLNAISQPVVVDALMGAIDAVSKMVQSLDWSMLTPIFATIFDVVQKIAPNLTALVNAILPYLPTLIDLFGTVAEVIGQVIPVLLDLFEPILNNEATMAALIAGFVILSGVINTVLPIIASLWPIITAVAGAISAAGGVLPALGAALAAIGGPITLIIAAIAALVAGLIWFFTQTELGQEIVQNVMTAIGDAFTWLNENVIQPVIAGIVTAWEWLADAVKAVWENFLKPIFDFIGGAIGFLASIVKFQIDLMVNTIRFMAAVYTWLWEHAVKPAIDAISSIMQILWQVYVQPIIDNINAALKLLGDFFTWLWEAKVKPAIDLIGAIIRGLWITYVQPIFDAIADAIEYLGMVFRVLYAVYVKPAWDNIQNILKVGWNWIDQNVFKPFRDGIAGIQLAFDNVSRALPAIWDTIKKAVAEPINFVLIDIWNNGLVKFWNGLVTELKLPDMKLKKADRIAFANGGVYKGGGMLPGYSPGRDIHTFFSPSGGLLKMSGGEGIIRPDALRKLGGKKWLDAVNGSRGRAMGDGKGTNIVGDIWDFIANAAKIAFEFFTDPAKAIQTHVIDGILKPMSKDQNVFGQTAAGVAANFMMGFVKPFTSAAPSAVPKGGMNYKQLTEIVKRSIPGASISSDYRPGAKTVNGGQSYHSLGRAIDIVPPNMNIFEQVRRLFPNASELIYTPAGGRQLPNANWSAAVKRQHYNHIHLAMRNGGIFDSRAFSAAGSGYRSPTIFNGSSNQGGSSVNNSRSFNVAEGAFQLSGADPWEVSLRTVNRLAERVGL